MIPPFSFASRHIGPRDHDIREMLATLGLFSLDELMDKTVPSQIRSDVRLESVGEGLSEHEMLADLRDIASRNTLAKSYIGMGYSGTITPPVIQRCLLEDPRWYTPYTPYQSEVSQGRLEALLNFQTMIVEMTGMEIANASLLDEATAAAEAMAMCEAFTPGPSPNAGRGEQVSPAFFVASDCHPQTIEVVRTRAEPLGIEVIIGDPEAFDFSRPIFGALLQYPATDGAIRDPRAFIESAHSNGALVVMAADLLALALLIPPGELGADIAVGSAQRFGVPMGYGGPHAAYLATREEYKRQIPGRIIGVSKDAEGRPGLRLALQTREQHIRRDKATSNICTAQALLANIAGMYAAYHGPEGIRNIAETVHSRAAALAEALRAAGVRTGEHPFFDTVRVDVGSGLMEQILRRAADSGVNLRQLDSQTLTVAVDETTSETDVDDLVAVWAGERPSSRSSSRSSSIPTELARTSPILTHPVFNRYHSETEMMRYLNRLANRDMSLAQCMIPLGSCTMKLNAAVEMAAVTWPKLNSLHPFAPLEQAEGYTELIQRLETMLAEITGFAAVSLQPNAGSQGEYAGLLIIRHYQIDRGQGHRNVCLIPQSAHGTNPASAAMCGMKIVVVKTDASGNVDVADLRTRAEEHSANLAALMITYPSTHGVFEESIREICDIVHRHGGQVYMDGANMNAQVGLCRPGEFGPDVCHLNLHKTFCIPHGGGGPGVGPICVAPHLAPYLPGHPVVHTGGDKAIGPVSAAPWGSPSILPISYSYIKLMGEEGLRLASIVSILNANYIARRLDPHFPVLYKGAHGLVAHECIVDVRPLKAKTGVEVEDVAKRLMDYGFHAPTVSFPVPGTLMIEPTESESKEELDQFCEAIISIRGEIAEIEEGSADRENNLLKNAPHTADRVSANEWPFPYSRERAAYPAERCRDNKWWPPVARIDNVYGERNLVCTCLPLDEYD